MGCARGWTCVVRECKDAADAHTAEQSDRVGVAIFFSCTVEINQTIT